MSQTFRELLKKVGSGTHTAKNLTRSEAKAAMEMMLKQEATPAQIGAFMIAHRIKRPTPEELAGMLDAYDELGPSIVAENLPFDLPVTVFCHPYDGRSRTTPVSPLTALILAAARVPVVMHGGDRMPTKYGISLVEIWQGLGVDLTLLSLSQVQKLLAATGFTFIYLPQHFPLANDLVTYREQIGKRPPSATLELMWSPYQGKVHLVCGFVHPPTEERFCRAFQLRQLTNYTTIKGLEGSCDLPRSRTGIIGLGQINQDSNTYFERLHLHPKDYGFVGKDIPLESSANLIVQLQDVLKGKPTELSKDVIWNGGFYLWRCGVCDDIAAGLVQAESMLVSGQVQEKLREIQVLSGDLSGIES